MQSFQNALAQSSSKRHLLLGNGFSIALRPEIFSYSSLFEAANFSDIPYADKIFNALNTRDFETVIRVLMSASRLLSAYSKQINPTLISQLQKDAAAIKKILVSAIAENHPDNPFQVTTEQFASCRTFLQHFSHIYTLNYDVLLYWALMQDEIDDLDIKPDDGFRHPEEDPEAPYVSWLESHSPTVHYLHGALHLFDNGSEITKYTWSKTDVPLLTQIRMALDEEKYPLFVSEGESRVKMQKILHNAYLHKAYRSLESICGQTASSLFIYGHSLAENDDHVLRRIVRGRISAVYISVFGDPDTPQNKKLIRRASDLASQRASRTTRFPLEVNFFDANSAAVWG